MKNLKRITFDPNVMGGKPTIRGLRVTVGRLSVSLRLDTTIRRFSRRIPTLKKRIFAKP